MTQKSRHRLPAKKQKTRQSFEKVATQVSPSRCSWKDGPFDLQTAIDAISLFPSTSSQAPLGSLQSVKKNRVLK